MHYLILAVIILLSPILLPVLLVLVAIIYLFGRPAKYQYHHDIDGREG